MSERARNGTNAPAADGGGAPPTDGRDAPPADGYNMGYAESLYERALRDRGLIPPSLAAAVGSEAGAVGPVATETLRLAAIAGALVESYRDHGHLAARLDPLGSAPPGHPMLNPRFHGVSRDALASLPSAALGLERLGPAVGDVLDQLESIYCGPIGYELDHMENPAQRDWLIDYIESGGHRRALSPDRARRLLERLSRVEGLEQFLHRAYLGKKRFSVEGLDMMVPMLAEILARSARLGTKQVFLGMAHRGRLNVLAHILGLSYESILAEFEEEVSRGIQPNLPELGSGDVKYHVGGRRRVSEEELESGEDELDIDVHLAPNPSHLEHVNPVVLGMARAARFLDPSDNPECVLPVLIHGDASFAGQGVVAETLNLCRLPAYETGGTLHLIANNQLGFTTLPGEGRSTRYASDLALGYRIPVVHVNADDPEACLAAACLAVDYRFEFGEDLVIDLVGYRRYGHNEGDEPGYTQPSMYLRIAEHPTVRTRWAERLIADGVVSPEGADRMADRVAQLLSAARETLQGGPESERSSPLSGPEPGVEPRPEASVEGPDATVETAVSADRLNQLNAALHRWPDGFEPFHKLGRQLERRRDSMDEGLDWAHAEALALASLLEEGVPVRLTGEDTERGTFSHRHLVLHEAQGGQPFVPLQHLSPDQARFEIANSPLSEIATLGFEYGFSTIALDVLVLWEAQFGDFANVGQAIIDQFIAAGHSKWGQESRIVLLLPHGHEGQGPEHSSARPERFLQLSAQGNLRVANCTTPAQYFHLLRLQALRPDRRPLVVMTPKSLLRHPRARSAVEALSAGRFRPVLADPDAEARADRITHAILCSGKVYYDLSASELRETAEPIAILRVEQLYPFPARDLRAALRRFPALEEVRWLQEEPENMGAWRFVAPKLRSLAGSGVRVRYVGREAKASPAEGYSERHARRQREIVTRGLTV